jgi:four helix bundle protein
MHHHVYSFEKLDLWKDVRTFIKDIYQITSNYPENEKFGLVNQMRRAVISVSSNLAEGSSRTGAKDQAHFYQISYSSLLEVLSQIIVSNDLNYIPENDYNELRKSVENITFKLNSLRNSALIKVKTS